VEKITTRHRKIFCYNGWRYGYFFFQTWKPKGFRYNLIYGGDMAISFFRRTPSPIGLDIGTNTLRVVQLKGNRKLPLLTHLAEINLPRGAVEEGEISDIPIVSESLRELWRKAGLRQRQVIIGIANQKVIVRLVELPYMSEEELRAALRYQAQEYIAIPIEEAILDFHIVGEFTTPEEEHLMEVLLVAGHRGMIQNFIDALQGADLEPVAIDLSSFALVRSLVESPLLPEEEGATVLMNIGAGITNLAVVEKGIPRFIRVTSLAGNDFTEAVADALGVSVDEAEQLKIEIGLPTEEAESSKKSKKGKKSSERLAQVQEVLSRKAIQFADEVRRSLDYYLTQTKVAGIQNIVLSGSGARLNNLNTFLERTLQVKVAYGRPLEKIEISSGLEEMAREQELSLAISIGLALRGVE